jgi:hypothetical protein
MSKLQNIWTGIQSIIQASLFQPPFSLAGEDYKSK